MLAYSKIPVGYMEEGLRNYFERGVAPGSFLRALLSNDLRGAVECADGYNRAALPEWVGWLYNEAPTGSWGSEAAVEWWIESVKGKVA